LKALCSGALFLCLALAGRGEALPDEGSQEEAAEEDHKPPPNARGILDAVVRRLPSEPLHVEGNLLVRQRRGRVVAELAFALHAEWGAVPSRASYTLYDAFGEPLERLTVTRPADGRGNFAYARGNPLRARPAPDLYAPIRTTDIGWIDLSLSYLWWPRAVAVGVDEVKGRPCHVIDVSRDRSAPAAPGAYARVRLWIDAEFLMMLRAEGFDGDGKTVRRMWVKSFKKIDERWMIKDMEVERGSGRTRTKLTVRSVTEAVLEPAL
jgi:hypothetical protein